MNRKHKALREIIGECDSMLFRNRPNMPYRGLDSTALRNGDRDHSQAPHSRA
jgi:hypothetical protein